MISEDQLKRVAAWSRELTEREIEVARAGITERSYGTGETVFMRGDSFDYWAGMVFGLARMGGVSRDGKQTSLAGLTAGAWFGEGSVLKNEPRRYDVVALRDSRIALMERSAFMWLFENSVGFNRFLVRQFNERLGQFIAMVEYDRTFNATARLARSIAWLFNPVLYPQGESYLEISQEEMGQLAGISRPAANEALKTLEARGLIKLERMGIVVRDSARLMRQRD
jgi:CRP/FNR family transcriptional regulator, cyclic AMP receptor protein